MDNVASPVYFNVDILTYQFIWSAFVVAAIRWMKKSNHPLLGWIDENTPRVNKAIAIIASGLVSLGIRWKFSYDPVADGGTLGIVFTGLSIAGLQEHARDWMLSYVVQQTGFRATEKSDALETLKQQLASLRKSVTEGATIKADA